MKNHLRFFRFALVMIMLVIICANASVASASSQTKKIGLQPSLVSDLYDTGDPVLTDIWVDAVNGSDSNDGSTPASAFRTLTAAWNSIPTTNPLTQGRRINLQPGTYTESMIPNYWENRYGTFTAPIFIRGNGSSRGEVVLQGTVNMYNVHYIYFENLSMIFNGDVFHCELCNHILLRDTVLNGGMFAHETIKANQSQYLYVEDSDIHGAYENAIDFVAVQYGHVTGLSTENGEANSGSGAYFLTSASLSTDAVQTDPNGNDQAHENMIPFGVARWIVKS